MWKETDIEREREEKKSCHILKICGWTVVGERQLFGPKPKTSPFCKWATAFSVISLEKAFMSVCVGCAICVQAKWFMSLG